MKNSKKSLLALSLLIILVFSLISCKDNTPASLWDNATYSENTTLGQGSKILQIEVKAEDKSIVFTVKTDAEYLGQALLDNKLVEGEVAQYGLYIKSVNGIRADYDLDGAYWGLTKNGEYLMTGVDQTVIADGEHYELTYTKG